MSSRVEIPGYMTATVENGRITGFVFNIAANDAGYFGEEIVNLEGDDLDPSEFFEMMTNVIAISSDKKSAFITVELGS